MVDLKYNNKSSYPQKYQLVLTKRLEIPLTIGPQPIAYCMCIVK